MASTSALVVTRRHLQDACDAEAWDLLDKLLERGADRSRGIWGDGATHTPFEVAEGNAAMTALLASMDAPVYVRSTDPALPAPSAADDGVNEQGEVRDCAGLVFPVR